MVLSPEMVQHELARDGGDDHVSVLDQALLKLEAELATRSLCFFRLFRDSDDLAALRRNRRNLNRKDEAGGPPTVETCARFSIRIQESGDGIAESSIFVVIVTRRNNQDSVTKR